MINWTISYTIMLCSFLLITKKDLYVVKNTIQNTPIKNSISIISGISLYFLLISIIFSLSFNLISQENIKYIQFLSISYIAYIGINVISKKDSNNIDYNNKITAFTDNFNVFKKSLFYSISNYKISFILANIIIQYYQYNKTLLNSCIIIFFPSIISFILLFIVCFIFFLLRKKDICFFKGKNINFNKLLGLIIVVLTAQNLSIIIK